MDWSKGLALLLHFLLMLPAVTAEDGVVPTSVLIAICVIVFFGTIAVVLCFIQFCIKNYNPLDYCYFCCGDGKLKKEGTMNASATNNTTLTAGQRSETVITTEDLYAKVRKQNKTDRELLILEKVKVDEEVQQNEYTTSEVLHGGANMREQVFVHDSNIILREQPTRYASDYSEQFEDGEIRTERFTYSTGYTPSSSQERLVVNMEDEDSDRIRYLLEHVEESRKEVRMTPSGETVIVVGDNHNEQNINMGLNIQDEENGVMTEQVTQQGGVRRITKRTIVTEQRDPVEETHREVRVIRTAPAENVEIREVYQDEEMSANHIENVEVGQHIIGGEIDEDKVQEAIDRIVSVTTAESNQDVHVTQTEEIEEGDSHRVMTTQVTKVAREVEPSTLLERREVHVVQSRPELPVPDYPLDEDIHEERHGTSIIQRRGQSVRESYIVGQNIDGEPLSNISRKRYTYHAEPSKVAYVEQPSTTRTTQQTVGEIRETNEHESQLPDYIESEDRQRQTIVRREERVDEGQSPSTYTYYMTEPQEPQQQSSVVRREYTEYHETEPTTTVVRSQSGQRGQTIVRREERVIESPETTTYTYHVEDPQEQSSVVRREYTEYQETEPTTTVVRSQSGQRGQTIVRREERVIESPETTTYTYHVEDPQEQSSVVRREYTEYHETEPTTTVVRSQSGQRGQTIVRREERVIESPETTTYTYHVEDPQQQSSVVRREYTEYHETEPATTVVRSQSGQRGQTIVRREERVIESPETTTYTYHVEDPQEQSSVVRREYTEYHETEPTTTVVRSQSGQRGQTIVRREERVIESPETTTYTYHVEDPQEQSSVVRREYTEYHETEPTTTVVRSQSGQRGQTIIRREEHVIESEPSTAVYMHGSGQEGKTIVTREEHVYEDNPMNFTTTEVQDGANGQVQGEVTYKIIKRISEAVEVPEVVKNVETTNKDWYVSSASFVKRNPVETIYIDLGPEEKLDTGTTTKTTTTTTYTVENIDE
ncbi:titin-like [Ptychodera flava]|uniref:titin-like n=1 Tax=Ptychodera flava TaxID=63121 RepID=UPI00396A4248